jgi:four helix bundle protein
MARFDFMTMPVYQDSQQIARACDGIAAGLPRFRWRSGDQLCRSSLSIVLNTAEGCGEFQPVEKARFYRMARRSAFETAACLHFLHGVGALDDAHFKSLLLRLERVCAALTALIKSVLRRPRP